MAINKTQKGDLLKVDPQLIDIEEGFNTRIDYGDIDELKLSIIENGVRMPLRGYAKDDRFIIVDGHRRLTAVRKAIEEGNEIARVPFILEEKKTLEERIFDIILSNDGKQLTSLELGETYKKLMQYGFTCNEIAKKIGKTLNHVNDMVKVASSSKELKEIIKKGGVSATLVAEIKNKIKDDDEAEELIKTVSSIKKESSGGEKKKEKVTKKDVEDLLPEKEKAIEVKSDEVFSKEEVIELLKKQIKECSSGLPLAVRIKVLKTKLVI